MANGLNLEDEKRLALLMAVSELGGTASKRSALNYIERNGWLVLSPHDLETMQSRNEPRWRNDIAFTRHHLVLNGCLDGSERDRWTLTDTGEALLTRLAQAARGSRLNKLAKAFAVHLEGRYS